jgi:hypothetical protein
VDLPGRSRDPAEDPGQTALIVAHPGHELMVYHWVERHRPLYCCLTDGSGGSATSRIASTTRLLERAGATVGPVYGRYPDRDVYALLLDGQVDAFVDLAKELAAVLAAAGVELVAGDAVEGFNPVHDVCRFVVDGAVAMLRQQTGREIRNYEFVLDAPPESDPEPSRGGTLWLRLDEAAVERKLAAVRAYPEMHDEVEAAIQRFGRPALALECLRPAATRSRLARFDSEPPLFDLFGQIRVSQGVYREVILYREHVLPVFTAIEKEAG